MYFAGTTSMGFLVTRMGDVYGRKWPSRISALASVPIQLAVLLSTNLNLTIILFFMLGMVGPGKIQVGFVYASEMLPEKYRTTIGSFILFNDSATMILLPVYHKLMSKSWLYF
jgi:MFS family permease